MAQPLSEIKDWEQRAGQAHYCAENLAVDCGVSERQLRRHFVKLYKKTAAAQLRLFQCARAMRFLLEGFSTRAVAQMVYFATSSHFCREFKKIYGLSPQHFAP